MTYRGQVKNGVVVLAAGSPGLTEGTLVDVTPVPATQAGAPRPGTASAVLRHAGLWTPVVHEVDEALDDLRATKAAEADAQLRRARETLESMDQ